MRAHKVEQRGHWLVGKTCDVYGTTGDLLYEDGEIIKIEDYGDKIPTRVEVRVETDDGEEIIHNTASHLLEVDVDD